MNKIVITSLLFAAHHIAVAQTNTSLAFQAGSVITLPSGASQSALVLADFNTDGKGDVAVCQRGLNSIGVYLQTTTGAFPANPNGTYAAGNAPSGLVAASLSNLSSRPAYDLVAISGPSSRWTVLMNTGTGQGTFTSATKPFGSAYLSTNPQLATAYLNRDNYPDFAFTYDAVGREELDWTGYLGGTNFSGGNGRPTGFAPPSFTIADFDRDGYMDVAYPNPAANQFLVVYATQAVGSPYWYPPNQVLTLSNTSTRPVHLAAGDVNNDSQPDLAVANTGSADIAVWLNTGTYQLGSASVYPLSAAPRLVQLADLNGDGKPELVTITADNQLQIFRHTGATGYSRYGTPLQLATGSDPTLLQIADMDGDNVRDIVVGCSGDNTVRVYLNRSLASLATTAPQLAGAGIYPNPATDYLRVEAGAIHEPLQATLLDVAGRTIREATLSPSNLSLPVSDLPRGLYLLLLANATGSSVVRVELR